LPTNTAPLYGLEAGSDALPGLTNSRVSCAGRSAALRTASSRVMASETGTDRDIVISSNVIEE
jgi:hypothetical protein